MIRRIFLDLDDACNTLAMHVWRLSAARSSRPITSNTRESSATTLWPPPIICWAQSGLPIRRPSGRPSPGGTGPICPSPKSFLGFCIGRLGWSAERTSASPPARRNAPSALAGKLEWIHAHFPSWMHRQYAITPRKHLFARPDALLIDDVEENILDFEAGGGHGVLVPRPGTGCGEWTHSTRWNSSWKFSSSQL